MGERRTLLLRASSAVVLMGLLAALANLQGVFVRARADAIEELDAHRALLAEYARRALVEDLGGRLRDARPRIEATLDDPLLDANGLYLSRDGDQRLPRQWQPFAAFEPEAIALYTRLLEGGSPDPSADDPSPWQERLALLEQLRSALLSSQTATIEQSFRKILRHEGRYVISARLDLTLQAALLDLFQRHASPARPLMQMRLRDGVTTASQRRDGLQRQLLRRRDRFSNAEFAWLAARVVEISERAGVRHDDFQARVAQTSAPTIAPPAGEQALLFHRDSRGVEWALAARGPGDREGIRVALRTLLDDTEAQMRSLGLIEPADGLEVTSLAVRPPRSSVPSAPVSVRLSDLEIAVASARWAHRGAEIQQQFVAKSMLGLGCGVLAVGVVVFATLAQRRRQRLLELKSDFIATVSHELRTPLASIRVQAETLERRIADMPGTREYPRRIVRDIDQLGFLVENLLCFNRLDRGHWAPVTSLISLAELVEDLREDLLTLGRRSFQIHAPDVEAVTFEADPDLVRLLFINLARNACSYNASEKVEITISTEADTILFGDNGVGIPTGRWSEVFDDFVRLADPRETRGSGLGLAICRRVAEAHGGRIAIRDSSPAGTIFEISLGRLSR